jgi:uncharacterized protein (TIGR02271 family)
MSKDVSKPTPPFHEEVTIPVIAEELAVEIQAIERGRIQVFKRIETREEIVNACSVHENIVVERIPFHRLLESEIPEVLDDGEVLIIPVIEEILITEERPVLKEEIRISKNRVTDTKSEPISLRREIVDIERIEIGSTDNAKIPSAVELQAEAIERTLPDEVLVTPVPRRNKSLTEEIVIPVVAEEVSINTQKITRAKVRGMKRVQIGEGFIDLSAVRDDFVIERVAVNRFLDDDESPATYQDGNALVIPVIEYVTVTEKKLSLREEVRITKSRTTTNVPQSVTLRREAIDIKRIEAE